MQGQRRSTRMFRIWGVRLEGCDHRLPCWKSGYLRPRGGIGVRHALMGRTASSGNEISISEPKDLWLEIFSYSEQWRLDDFQEAYPDRPVVAPLIECGLTKTDCKTMLERAGITLLFMYLQGYQNANCIGCVKGGAGYFRAREDYPEEFKRLADVEAEIGPGAYYILRHRSGPLKGRRFPLHQLPAGKADHKEWLPACGITCEIAEQEYTA